jgi:hypothetical protein
MGQASDDHTVHCGGSATKARDFRHVEQKLLQHLSVLRLQDYKAGAPLLSHVAEIIAVAFVPTSMSDPRMGTEAWSQQKSCSRAGAHQDAVGLAAFFSLVGLESKARYESPAQNRED